MIDIISYSAAESPVGKLAAILDRRDGQPADVEEAVQEILRQVRASGDDAVVEYTSRFDGVTMTPQSMRVSAKALADAGEAMDSALLAAVRAAAANIRAFHQKQHTNSWFTEDGDGVILGKRVSPLRRVGICVPGGQAPLISSLLMAAIPAQVAGVEEICVVTPPTRGGLPHAEILATAQLLGLSEIYAVGGAQAVGALAFGTATIPAVDKIVGPGSPYTVAAKRQVFGIVGIEMIPGPSEIAILADDSADPRFAAADLLSQAEHGSGHEAAVCIATSQELARKIVEEVVAQAESLPRVQAVREALARYGAVIVVADLDTGVDLLNRIAPEHAELLVKDPWTWLQKIRNAGAVFLGPASTEPVGDYFAGTNHILPTNGAARYASSLGLSDFVKTTSVVSYSAERLRQVGPDIMRIARAEGLEAHARAVQVRLDSGDPMRRSR